ncbi:hypothetical protein D5018_04305 [Parashewanella curva]|uniref:Uncharacterized protein n=1 Tax=Parashewanella curva TaxID=2338552 RepID=A0A3L8PZT3_9GAMM|nr:hypothetical protein [Parashewanella curva]RLV60871.1 hypothetical protein D5018_04305 [Parashewanella curva]
MKVEKKVTISETHSIEIGTSSWSSKEKSIRSRYDSLETGKFSPHASSELPIPDLQPIIKMAAENDLLSISQCSEMIVALSKSISKQVSS